jgi:hypothetical protein
MTLGIQLVDLLSICCALGVDIDISEFRCDRSLPQLSAREGTVLALVLAYVKNDVAADALVRSNPCV